MVGCLIWTNLLMMHNWDLSLSVSLFVCELLLAPANAAVVKCLVLSIHVCVCLSCSCSNF